MALLIFLPILPKEAILCFCLGGFEGEEHT